MKERVAGARVQSADGNYRRPYESGQLIRLFGLGEDRAQLFRKTEVGGRHFRFLVAFGGEISEFPGEKVISGLV